VTTRPSASRAEYVFPSGCTSSRVVRWGRGTRSDFDMAKNLRMKQNGGKTLVQRYLIVDC